jgi:hypothetical protein
MDIPRIPGSHPTPSDLSSFSQVFIILFTQTLNLYEKDIFVVCNSPVACRAGSLCRKHPKSLHELYETDLQRKSLQLMLCAGKVQERITIRFPFYKNSPGTGAVLLPPFRDRLFAGAFYPSGRH